MQPSFKASDVAIIANEKGGWLIPLENETSDLTLYGSSQITKEMVKCMSNQKPAKSICVLS